VGDNGIGKTTLLTRVVKGDIMGWPQDMKTVYVQHEVLAELEETVMDFALKRCAPSQPTRLRTKLTPDNPGGSRGQRSTRTAFWEGSGASVSSLQQSLLDTRGSHGWRLTVCVPFSRSADVSLERATSTMKEVGFSDEQIGSGMVNELSGGWRMKLAIACAMLQDATFLMLDEPTNHLDVNAVKWLIEYLCQLKGTTILFVSHDQDFLAKVATDVIHFADQQLSYYPGYAAFRSAQPDAALGAFKAFQARASPAATIANIP
jgi:ATPase subunit of ABC transporter with duplicated ATPase domains